MKLARQPHLAEVLMASMLGHRRRSSFAAAPVTRGVVAPALSLLALFTELRGMGILGGSQLQAMIRLLGELRADFKRCVCWLVAGVAGRVVSLEGAPSQVGEARGTDVAQGKRPKSPSFACKVFILQCN